MGGYGVDLDGDKFSHVKCAEFGHSIFILKVMLQSIKWQVICNLVVVIYNNQVGKFNKVNLLYRPSEGIKNHL